MTVFIPTTTVALLRGTTVDTFGDEIDVDVPITTGLPAAVTENAQRSYRRAEGRGGQVETFTVRLRPGTDVTEQDRLRDERTGAVYLVTSVSHPQALTGLADVRVTAARVGAASTP